MRKFGFLFLILAASTTFAQSTKNATPGYWQQAIKYKMSVDFNHKLHQYAGNQTIEYTNNSPDTLKKLFFHLYFNAFQPGSMMDVRSRTIEDPDARVRARIAALKPNEVGFLHLKSISRKGVSLQMRENETILEVTLDKPILPGEKTTFETSFEGQVPVQIRRSGRNNAEGVDYSMSQWYPKMCEYDKDGWNTTPYVGREFHGVWGDFDVKITIDSSYLLGGTGYLQNPQEIGKGYQTKGTVVKPYSSDRLTWHFIAPNVHDFMWAADPNYVHKRATLYNGTELHFLHLNDTIISKNWDSLMVVAQKSFKIANQKFGEYPYKQFSFIQGGDGGMEYPMATLIVGKVPLNSLIGTAIHEKMHNWYYGMLATNEAKYPWMDEGFTSYAEDIIIREIQGGKGNPLDAAYQSYFKLATSGREEPLSTPADFFSFNSNYGNSSYSKGSVFLHQLSYIVGQPVFDSIMLEYYRTWRFKHPTPSDFKRVAEKVSGIELEWYFDLWIGTTFQVDYAVNSLVEKKDSAEIILERVGKMPMPLEVLVTYTDGSKQIFYIPLTLMQGQKSEAGLTIRNAWPWTYPYYRLNFPLNGKSIQSVSLDPSEKLADLNKKNNTLPHPENATFR